MSTLQMNLQLWATLNRRRVARMVQRLGLGRSFGCAWTALVALCIAQAATAQPAEVRLGGLFQHKAVKVGRFAAFVMAVLEINNSTELLPHHNLTCGHDTPLSRSPS